MNIQKITKTHLFPKGFTLIELIVVITILAILGTIGFLSIGGYSSKARDSSRISDVANISKSLDVSIITVGTYPTPDNSFAVTYSGGTIWNQGTISTNVLQALRTSIAGGGLSKKPVDPLDNSEYEYSSLAFGKAYQIKAEYEGDLNQTAYHLGTTSSLMSLLASSLIEEVEAAPGSPTIAYIKGNYGGLVAKTVTGSITYVLTIPSIMSSTGSANATLKIESNHLSGALLFNGKNLKNASTFNPISVVYSGTGTAPNSDQQASSMIDAIKTAYSSATDINSNQSIATLLNASDQSLSSLTSAIIKDQLGGTATVSVVTEVPAYSFSGHTFTNCGISGRTGPSLANCRSSYSSVAWTQDATNNYLNMSTNGIQEWTVPASGTYKISAYGAGVASNGGRGAKIEGDVSLIKGQKLKILVGQQGYNDNASQTSGNGGTFVTTIDNQPIMIAGGGGASYCDSGAFESCGRITNNGGNSYNPWYGSALGGVNAAGGSYISSNSQGGAGLTGNGLGSSTLAQSFVNGGVGGNWGSAGGFGGGGGVTSWGGGGGGGYGGGAASYNGSNCGSYASGAGGGSYNSGINRVEVSCNNNGHGKVDIVKLTPVAEVPLYTFATHTFTNCGTTGRTGPALSTCRSSYSAVSWAQDTTNNYLSMPTNGIQEWIVPSSGMYKISANGAGVASNGGRGAKIEGDVYLTKSQKLRILVGQQGYPGGSSDLAGHGGTFVTTIDNQPIMIAGGGGGGYCDTGTYESCGRTSTIGGNTYNPWYGSVANGGTGGAGGSYSSNGGGGSGMYGNGFGASTLAQSFVNGGAGGSWSYWGGFGGGGGTTSWGGGGGGGYSGGGGSYNGGNCGAYATGAGGASFNSGANKVEVSCSNNGHGNVVITKL